MKYYIVHKTQGWIAAITWSHERAEKWLSEFNPQIWTDKSLKVSDFKVEIRK